MNKPSILLVEDSEEIYFLINHFLGFIFDIEWASSLEGAQKKIQEKKNDLYLLDVGLPDGDGVQLCADLQEQHPDIPIFILTSHLELSEKIRAFMAGADDYIVKPFEPLELRARIESKLAKMSKFHENNNFLLWREIRIDKLKQEVCVLDNEAYVKVDLTALEFRLLAYLAGQAGNVITRDKILDEIWGKEINVYQRSVDTHVSKLRKKLGPVSCSIKSVRGSGYKFCPAS